MAECEKCKRLQAELDKRNLATKVWIDSDTQVRAYAIELERKVAELEGKQG